MRQILSSILWLAQLAAGLAAEPGFSPLFNGRDLSGWDGKPGWWRVEDGAITAESTPEKPCTKHNYLIWRGGEPADFELRFEYRIIGGNSGVQFRSREVPDWDMRGYQADIEDGPQWTGALFEHERGGIALRGEKVVIAPDGRRQVERFADAAALQKGLHTNGWNEYRVVARGAEIELFINGVKTAHAVDRQLGRAAARGLIGLQMHPGPPMKVQFRNLRLKTFALAAAATPAEKLTVAHGYKVDLLYSPAKDSEGSWVSLCADPRGRLYASGQYDEGLFRITLPTAGGDAPATRVDKLPVDLSSAQGLCWAFDSLYALVSKNGKTPSGLYRVRDTDGDDVLDQVQLLCALEGGGDHGWHGVIPTPDGKALCVVAGNNTTTPRLGASRVPPHWSEDHLLPRLPDAGGHMKGVLAPGGVLYRVSPDGRDWEMLAMGFRNTYDAAFNREGELFTYDADMEWDMGTPWYRPTRICLAVSGAEFGWRNGTGKWPAYLPDSLPAVLDIGPGSPTGVTFGQGAKFPARYREALFAADWTFGRIYAVHLRPDGSAYRGESEVFVSGVPLPVVDLVVHPTDGALYFITGGWRIQTGLYRVRYTGGAEKEPAIVADTSAELRAVRRKLETFHGRRDSAAVNAAWPYLGHKDRFLSFAARVALEWQDPASWHDRALSETNPAAALNALLALVRVSAKDEFHRNAGLALSRAAEQTSRPGPLNGKIPSTPADKMSAQQPDTGLAARVSRALERFDWRCLHQPQRIALLRAYTLCFTRLGAPDDATRSKLLARLEPCFPANDRALNSELCQLLVYLQSPRIGAAALARIRAAPTQEEQLDYIKSLRMLRAGWTPELRREYFAWFNRAAGYRGGSSFAGFLKMIKADALATLPEPEKLALVDLLDAPPPTSPMAALSTALAGRTNSSDWTVAALVPAVEGGLKNRELESGRRMFGATGCFQCHRFAGEGGAVGPDLTQVAGRFSPRDLLEAILEPSKTVSDLYGNVVITRRDGEQLIGRIVYHTHDDVVMLSPDMFNPAETVRVDRKDIVSIEPSPVSPMPEGLLSLLTRDEVLDLLAYLVSGGSRETTLQVAH
jgi:putative heme-binding domain-containing protein